MNANKSDKAYLLIASISLAISILIAKLFAVFPWWSFIVPVFILGIVFSYKKWNIPAFNLGFLVGFSIWAGVNMVYALVYKTGVFGKVAAVMGLPSSILIIASGLVGGMLTGLAFYAGKTTFYHAKPSASSF